ncbi:hypothetical protein QFC22_003674 [Naganishia vaughanmartiniae]|uniref:Uncharacterized protein n=1 Tax=Naganishia vaughanmartiniae TaxID=1424756 RepID=A0ACC2X5J0_9TREE|nr:hypothetical protein QFC22_003674 [Naganishia vaughanmartiniae]
MVNGQMGSPPRYGYSYGYRPPSPSQDRTASRPKLSEFEHQAFTPQDPASNPSAYQLPRPTSMQPRYNASEPQRYLDTVPYPANQNHPPPPRIFTDHVRSPVFPSAFQSQGSMMGNRHTDGTSGGMYPSLTQTNTPPTGNMYESRPAYNMHSSHTGSSSSLGAPGQFSWSQSQNMPHLNVGGMAVDTQQSSAAYQSSVSPVISTGGMPFARPGGARNTHSVDDEFDGRTRNAKAQKRHREKRKAHVKHLEETVLALQNHVRTLTRNQPLDSSGRSYLSPLAGGIPSQAEHEEILSRNAMLLEENQSLRAEIDNLRLRLSELQGLNYPMSTSVPADMNNRMLATGHIGTMNPTSSAITPISEDEPNRSLSLNLPSLTVGVKAESVSQHYSSMDMTPTTSPNHMQSYGPTFGHSGTRRYYSSNIDQSPPLQPLTAGSNPGPNHTTAPHHVYHHRYDIPQNHNHEVGTASGFPTGMSSASLQMQQRHPGPFVNSAGVTHFTNQEEAGYGTGPPTGASKETAIPTISGGEGGSKSGRETDRMMSR